MKKRVYLVLITFALLGSSNVYAANKPVKVTCPKVIGNLATGEFATSKGNYKCFSSTSAAKKEGLINSAPSFTSWTFTGTTDQSTSTFATTRPARVTYSYIGGGHFSIVLRRAADGDYQDLLANDTDTISGIVSIPKAGSYYMDVSGVGQWTINVSPR